jgi:hypothetical protein
LVIRLILIALLNLNHFSIKGNNPSVPLFHMLLGEL